MLPTPAQVSDLQKINDEVAKLEQVFKASSPGLEAEQMAWENEIRSLLGSTDPTDFAWCGRRTSKRWQKSRNMDICRQKMKHLFSVNCYHVARQQQMKRPSNTLSKVPIGSLPSLKAINCLLMSGLIPKHHQKQSCSNGTTGIGITALFGVKTKLTSVELEITHLLTNRWVPCQKQANGFDLKWTLRM